MLLDEDEEPVFELTDYDWVIAALSYAMAEDLTLEDISPTINIASTGEQFDAGVTALIRLKEICGGSF